MLEIISLIIILKHVGRLAATKGLDIRKWKIYTIVLFFILEITGGIFGLFIFAHDNLFSIGLVGIAFGITSYPLIQNYIFKLPDPPPIEENQ